MAIKKPNAKKTKTLEQKEVAKNHSQDMAWFLYNVYKDMSISNADRLRSDDN